MYFLRTQNEIRLVTVPKFQTYDSSGVECNTYSSVQIDKSIVSNDLVSYALSHVERGVNRKLLLIFSSHRFTTSDVLTHGKQKVVFIQVRETKGDYLFVLHFDDANDANKFRMDIEPHRDPTSSILSEGCLVS